MPTKKIDPRVYLKLEKALAVRLKKHWRPLLTAVYIDIAAAVDVGDFTRAYELAYAIDCTGVGTANREYIKYVLRACINYGGSMAAGNTEPIVAIPSHEKLLNRVTDGFLHAIEYNTTVQSVKAAVQSIAQAEQRYGEATKADEPKSLYLDPLQSFADPSEKMLMLVSSLHTSRLATWGYTAEADAMGYEEYQLSAVLDNRTSDFCRMISGKVFKVADAKNTIEHVLSLQNPDDAKGVQPWPSQSKEAVEAYGKLSAEELTAKNLHIPPFHPFCRTILVHKGKAPRASKPDVAPNLQVLDPTTSTVDTFKELGLSLTENEVKHWNDYMGVSPTAVLGKLSDTTPLEVLNGALASTNRLLKVLPNGDISFSLKGTLGKAGNYHATVLYDVLSGSLFPDYMKISKANQKRATEFYKSFYGGLIDVGQSVGAADIVVAVGGDTGAFMHAKAGFLPSAGAWFDLAADLLALIIEGGKHFGLFTLLKEEQRVLILKLLDVTDPMAMHTLANLPFDSSGSNFVQKLLDSVEMEMVLDLTNPNAVAKAHKVFK
jgi:hypothetical protein